MIAAAIEAGDEAEEGPPWPLTRADVAGFESADVRLAALEEFTDSGFHRRRAEFARLPRRRDLTRYPPAPTASPARKNLSA